MRRNSILVFRLKGEPTNIARKKCVHMKTKRGNAMWTALKSEQEK